MATHARDLGTHDARGAVHLRLLERIMAMLSGVKSDDQATTVLGQIERRLGGPTAEPATIRSTPTTRRSAGRVEADAQPQAEANRGIALNREAAPSSGPSRPAELRPDAGIAAEATATGPGP